MSRFVLMVLLLIFAPWPARAEDAAAKQRVEKLVAQLASPNKAPLIRGPSAKYPPQYDHEAQDRVWDAYEELCDLGTVSFPYLFQHFDDKRYALTADTGAADTNFTVGALCFAIVDLHLQPYKVYSEGQGDRRARATRPHYATHFKLKDPAAARAWWEPRKGKTMRELQIEVLEWIVSEETKEPAKYGESERRWLAETLESLRKSDEPLQHGYPWAL
ncbi:MAG: hypothetical protein ACTHK7_17255 [Aureliella sp.]